jgi:hypothetical protein
MPTRYQRIRTHSVASAFPVAGAGWHTHIQPYFSPGAISPERKFWFPNQTNADDGGTKPNFGGAPFRQPCFA